MNIKHIDFSTIREDFSIYEIESGLVLRTKQIVTDIVVETTEDNKKMTRLGTRDVSFVVVTDVNKIDTTNFDAFVVPDYQPGAFGTPAQVVPIGEVNELLTEATQNVLPYP